MEFTDKEAEIASRYMAGEYTEVQLNWILHENKMDRERLDAISDWMAYAHPAARAVKFLFVYAIISIALRISFHFAGLL